MMHLQSYCHHWGPSPPFPTARYLSCRRGGRYYSLSYSYCNYCIRLLMLYCNSEKQAVSFRATSKARQLLSLTEPTRKFCLTYHGGLQQHRQQTNIRDRGTFVPHGTPCCSSVRGSRRAAERAQRQNAVSTWHSHLIKFGQSAAVCITSSFIRLWSKSDFAFDVYLLHHSSITLSTQDFLLSVILKNEKMVMGLSVHSLGWIITLCSVCKNLKCHFDQNKSINSIKCGTTFPVRDKYTQWVLRTVG